MHYSSISLKRLIGIALVTFSLLFAACKDDDDPEPDNNNNSGGDFETNASAQLEMSQNLDDLSSAMKEGDGENNGTIDQAELEDIFEKGSPSLYSTSTAYYRDSIVIWFAEMAAASQSGSYDPEATPAENGEGGTLGDHLFDEHGQEFEQYIEKGLYGASHFNMTVNVLFEGEISVADLHKAIALYGTTPDDPSEGDRKWTAHYADDHENETLGQTYNAVIMGSFTAAIQEVNDNGSISSDHEMIQLIVNNWEAAIAARAIHYINAGINGFPSATNNIDIANTLHEFAEGIGLIHGLYNVSNTTISDNQLENIMSLLHLEIGGSVNLSAFYGSNGDVSDLEQARTEIANIYGFSNAENY